MLDKIKEWGHLTVLMFILAIIILVPGAVVVIMDTEALSYKEYLELIKDFAYAVAAAFLGKGIFAGLKAWGSNRSAPVEVSVEKATVSTRPRKKASTKKTSTRKKKAS